MSLLCNFYTKVTDLCEEFAKACSRGLPQIFNFSHNGGEVTDAKFMGTNSCRQRFSQCVLKYGAPEALDITRKFMNEPVRILMKHHGLTLKGSVIPRQCGKGRLEALDPLRTRVREKAPLSEMLRTLSIGLLSGYSAYVLLIVKTSSCCSMRNEIRLITGSFPGHCLTSIRLHDSLEAVCLKLSCLWLAASSPSLPLVKLSSLIDTKLLESLVNLQTGGCVSKDVSRVVGRWQANIFSWLVEFLKNIDMTYTNLLVKQGQENCPIAVHQPLQVFSSVPPHAQTINTSLMMFEAKKPIAVQQASQVSSLAPPHTQIINTSPMTYEAAPSTSAKTQFLQNHMSTVGTINLSRFIQDPQNHHSSASHISKTVSADSIVQKLYPQSHQSSASHRSKTVSADSVVQKYQQNYHSSASHSSKTVSADSIVQKLF
ncbi:hypothetical protein LguiB_026830 [Lonicera macranthoides]